MTTHIYEPDHDRHDERATLTADAVLLAPDDVGALHVLLVERRYDPHAGCWAIPGGKLNQGECDHDAARRECAEETGVAPTEMTELGCYRVPGRDPRGRYVSFAWVARLDRMATPRAADDAERADWFPADALPPLAFDHAEIIADALRVRPNKETHTDRSAR